MKWKSRAFFLFTLLSILCSESGIVLAEERKGKAVYETSTELGMKLTDKALVNIEVKTMGLISDREAKVPSESLVYFQDYVGVYRLRDGWWKLIKVSIKSKALNFSVIQSNDLKAQDQIVVHGADLMRVSELDAFGAGE